MLSTLTLLLTSASPAVSAPPLATAAADQQAVPPVGAEIVVTARRREERAQDVPIAMSVIDAGTISNTGAFNVNRLQQQQPALQFYSSNPRNSSINIRGLGTPFGLTNDGIEQGVGFYLDGVYVGRVGASTFDFVDVDRVEVLRGPQGTLYGKNTTAGAVNITTRAPSFTPEAQVEASAGNYDYWQIKGSASGPIVADKLAARLSMSITRRAGTVLDVKTGEDLQRLDNFSIRGQLLWKPRADISFRLTGDFNVQNPFCCVQYYARIAPTQRPLNRRYAALAAAAGYAPPSTDPFARVTDLDASINSRQEMGGASLVGNWDLGPATITSVSAWRYWDWKPANDRDFTGLPITTVSQNPSQQKQWSQELRLASNGKRKLDYTVGLFYFHQQINTQGSQVQGPAASAWLLNPTSAAGRNPDTLNGLTSTNDIHFDNDSFAVFGKLNWQPIAGLHLQPGLRVNYDRKNGSYIATVSINNATYANKVATCANPTVLTADQLNTLAPQCYSPKFSDWNVSGDVTLFYDFSSDIHGYATYARSFKSGGINLSGLPLNATNTGVDLTAQTVKPETENHYEFGLKMQFLNRKLTLNLAAFWTDVFDYQATVNNGQTTVIRGYLANAGLVRVRGIEFDSSFRPSPRLSFYTNGAYTDATYLRFTNAPCPPELTGGTVATAAQTPGAAGVSGALSPLTCDISGGALPGISKWSFSFGGEINAPIGQGQIYLGYDGSYRSRFSSNPSPSAYTWIDGYSLSNFRLGYRRDSFNIFAWVRNAFDQNYFELLSTQSGSTGLIVGQPGDPRTYGATISKRF
ncbi:MAG: TonB-dependent receptor [Sphingomonas sp.]